MSAQQLSSTVRPPQTGTHSGVSKRLDFLLQENGFQTIAYFVFETEVRFILVTSRFEGYDLLLQIPPDMRFEAKRDGTCVIELIRADDKWLKQAGDQAQIDIKYVSRNMKQLLLSIEENVQVHHRVQRLKLAWYDPVRYLLVTETHSHQPPLRFAIRDMAQCPEWMAARPIIWFSTMINDLFSRSFSMWDEAILTGKWLRNTIWADQMRLWTAMNRNWSQILGDRLSRPNEGHPFSADFETYDSDIHNVQIRLAKLRKLGAPSRDLQTKGSELLLHLQRNVGSALLYWQDVLDDWHSFFPAFQHQWEATQRFTHLSSANGKKKDSGKLTAWASEKLHGIMDWLSNGEQEELMNPETEHNESLPMVHGLPPRDRPKNRRIEQLQLDLSDSEKSDPESDTEEQSSQKSTCILPPIKSDRKQTRFEREVSKLDGLQQAIDA